MMVECMRWGISHLCLNGKRPFVELDLTAIQHISGWGHGAAKLFESSKLKKTYLYSILQGSFEFQDLDRSVKTQCRKSLKAINEEF